MTFDLTNWRGRAKGILDRLGAPHDRDDAVKADRFDRHMFDEMLDAARPLRNAVEELKTVLDDNVAEDLLRDVFLGLWKDDPALRPTSQMRDDNRINNGIVKALMQTPEWDDLRRMTRHDKYTATLAAASLTDDLKTIAAETKARAEEDRRRVEEARQRAQQAAQQVVDAPVDPDDPTAVDEVLVDELEAAIAEFDDVNGRGCLPVLTRVDADLGIDDAKDEIGAEAALFRNWGVDPGELQWMSFEERAELAAALAGHRLAKYHALIGRMRLMAAAQKAHKVVDARDDVVDVGLSNDLSRVLMSEFVTASADPSLMLDLQRRFAESQLLSREYEGIEEVGAGPIIACVDTSESMSKTAGSFAGEPVTREAWAKAACLALLDESVRLRRRFVGINFASRNQLDVFESADGQINRAQMLGWVAKFFNGGTDFDRPLTTALDAIENDPGLRKADIVFITDGECRVSPVVLDRLADLRERIGVRVFGIAIAASTRLLDGWCDHTQTVNDLSDVEQLEHIFQSLA